MISVITPVTSCGRFFSNHIIPMGIGIDNLKSLLIQRGSGCIFFACCPIADCYIRVEGNIVFQGLSYIIEAITEGQCGHSCILHPGCHTVDKLCICGICCIIHAGKSALIRCDIEHGTALTGKVGDVLLSQCLYKVNGSHISGIHRPIRALSACCRHRIIRILYHRQAKLLHSHDNCMHMAGSIEHGNNTDPLVLGILDNGIHLSLSQFLGCIDSRGIVG